MAGVDLTLLGVELDPPVVAHVSRALGAEVVVVCSIGGLGRASSGGGLLGESLVLQRGSMAETQATRPTGRLARQAEGLVVLEVE